ncbi:MAG: hypothetical protein Q9226_001712 [Calogaya cf. arnoldii]
MGSFTFNTSSTPAKFLSEDTTRLTVRLEGLHYIAEHAPALIPDISEVDIRDKSKADGLAKVLDISFLEINTFAHAVCALLIYALWWHKPLDIESLSLLTGELAWEMCALMHHFSGYSENLLETELSRGQKYEDRVIARWTDVFSGRHLWRLKAHQSQPRAILRWDSAPRSQDGTHFVALETSDIRAHPKPVEAIQIRKGDSLFGFCCMDVYTQADWCRAFPATLENFLRPPRGEKDHRHLAWLETLKSPNPTPRVDQ